MCYWRKIAELQHCSTLIQRDVNNDYIVFCGQLNEIAVPKICNKVVLLLAWFLAYTHTHTHTHTHTNAIRVDYKLWSRLTKFTDIYSRESKGHGCYSVHNTGNHFNPNVMMEFCWIARKRPVLSLLKNLYMNNKYICILHIESRIFGIYLHNIYIYMEYICTTHLFICVCMWTYICLYVCMYVYTLYIHIYNYICIYIILKLHMKKWMKLVIETG
jgi:hypothetical protein